MSAAMHKWLLAYLLPTAWLIESWLLLFIVFVSRICQLQWGGSPKLVNFMYYDYYSLCILCDNLCTHNVPSICALTFVLPEGDFG